jgi:hypothetical protein
MIDRDEQDRWDEAVAEAEHIISRYKDNHNGLVAMLADYIRYTYKYHALIHGKELRRIWTQPSNEENN